MLTCYFENGNKAYAGSLRHVVADALVLKDNKILLQRRSGTTPNMTEVGKWALAGGYIELNETIAEGIQREILEETGWKIKDLTLLWVNDNPRRAREDRQNVVFAYFCTATEKVADSDKESDDTRWFPLDEVPPEDELAFDHAANIELYKEYKANPFPLPRVGKV